MRGATLIVFATVLGSCVIGRRVDTSELVSPILSLDKSQQTMAWTVDLKNGTRDEATSALACSALRKSAAMNARSYA
jgi:hypothetical protein